MTKRNRSHFALGLSLMGMLIGVSIVVSIPLYLLFPSLGVEDAGLAATLLNYLVWIGVSVFGIWIGVRNLVDRKFLTRAHNPHKVAGAFTAISIALLILTTLVGMLFDDSFLIDVYTFWSVMETIAWYAFMYVTIYFITKAAQRKI